MYVLADVDTRKHPIKSKLRWIGRTALQSTAKMDDKGMEQGMRAIYSLAFREWKGCAYMSNISNIQLSNYATTPCLH